MFFEAGVGPSLNTLKCQLQAPGKDLLEHLSGDRNTEGLPQ